MEERQMFSTKKQTNRWTNKQMNYLTFSLHASYTEFSAAAGQRI
jgi:hypothetical protein